MKLNILIFLTMLPLLHFGQSKTANDIEVRHINGNMINEGHQLFYCLPRNLVVAEITLKHTINTAGPYATYADEFLNITEGVIFESSEYYEIGEVKFHRISKPDSSQFYCIFLNSTENPPLINLNPDYTLVSINTMAEPNEALGPWGTLPLNQMDPAPFYFTDLGIKPFTSENKVTLYKTVQTDSTPTKVPVTQTKIDPKSEEQNALAAAAFVRKIRKRKLKLLTGEFQESIAPDGVALARMVDEVKALEQSYIELFTGHVQELTEKVYLVFEPDTESQGEQQVIGWFSVTKGISAQKPDLRTLKYEPLSVKIETITNVPSTSQILVNLNTKKPEPIKHGLYYRIPAMVDITLQCGTKNLAKTHFTIAQKGQTTALPVKYLEGTRYGIEFYPETGALKSIKENK